MSYHRDVRTTLFVAGISSRTRARDLAYEFERYGRLVRCDIPAPRSPAARPYAFVEFEDTRDAEDAYYEMQGRKVDGHPLNIQWAKNTPGRNWRFEPRRGGERSRSPPPRSRRASRSRSKSPRRRPSRSPIRSDREDRRRSRSPRDRRRDERDDRDERRGSNVDIDIKAERSPMKREASPFGNGRRSPSPSRRRGDSLSPRD